MILRLQGFADKQIQIPGRPAQGEGGNGKLLPWPPLAQGGSKPPIAAAVMLAGMSNYEMQDRLAIARRYAAIHLPGPFADMRRRPGSWRHPGVCSALTLMQNQKR
ncbi:MAG: hypothetical protein ACO1N5_18005 [Noviherbaspirillum sp.]